MSGEERWRTELGAAMAGAINGQSAADRLCQACVGLLEVDGASISLTLAGTNRGTYGSSGALARQLDELQFTFGEGPCLDAVHTGVPVLVADLNDPAETRWPAFTGAVLQSGVSAVFALPVSVSDRQVGALDLFRNRPGPLGGPALAGGLLAAELAAGPLLDMLSAHTGRAAAGQDDDGWTQLAGFQRVEVYQAMGMIMGALDVDSAEALVRLRGHAFAHGMTASQVAWEIVERQLSLDTPDWRDAGGGPG